LLGILAPYRGLAEDGNQSPAKATLPPRVLSLLEQKKMPKRSPVLIRIFKEESELEVWKQDTTGRFELLKVFPICRWSGDLGPKISEGDRQAPEGFYTITPGLMNPNSNYYLAINTGFPNAYDRANDRHGGFLMIHGDCSSRGCYAMTDEQIGEIYSLAHESFLGGQPSFQIQAYPFRMTPANLARHRTSAPARISPSGRCSRSATTISRRRISNRRSTSATSITCSTLSNRRMDRSPSCSIQPANVPLSWSPRKSLKPRWGNNTPTRSSTPNWSEPTLQWRQFIADWTAE
jgi:hypothetical protein